MATIFVMRAMSVLLLAFVGWLMWRTRRDIQANKSEAALAQELKDIEKRQAARLLASKKLRELRRRNGDERLQRIFEDAGWRTRPDGAVEVLSTRVSNSPR